MHLTAIQLLNEKKNAYEGMGEKKGFALHFIQIFIRPFKRAVKGGRLTGLIFPK